MTDAQLGKWLAAFRVGALKPILERFEPGDVIDALVALLRDVLRLGIHRQSDPITVQRWLDLLARLRAVLGERL